MVTLCFLEVQFNVYSNMVEKEDKRLEKCGTVEPKISTVGIPIVSVPNITPSVWVVSADHNLVLMVGRGVHCSPKKLKFSILFVE